MGGGGGWGVDEVTYNNLEKTSNLSWKSFFLCVCGCVCNARITRDWNWKKCLGSTKPKWPGSGG